MAFEQKEGQGVLWKNDRREKDSQPNARGTALIGGVVYEISAWTKRKTDGEPFQSLAFKRKDSAKGERTPTKAEAAQAAALDAEIPF